MRARRSINETSSSLDILKIAADVERIFLYPGGIGRRH